MKSRQLLIGAFFAIFMFIGLMALKDGMPSEKNERVYTILQKHIPYKLEKRAGGFSIKSEITGIKEKPPAKDVFLRLEQLEKQWGKEFLRLNGNTLSIVDKDEKEILQLELKSDVELLWVKDYFEIKK